jgi:hypothetical protein
MVGWPFWAWPQALKIMGSVEKGPVQFVLLL